MDAMDCGDRVRKTRRRLLRVVVASLLCAMASPALAQVGHQRVRRDEQSGIGRDEFHGRVPLQNPALERCAGQDCLKIRLGDLGTDLGLHFASIPRAPRNLFGVLCSCKLTNCWTRIPWPDDNPLSDWSPVKANQNPSVISDLRRADNQVWVIRWSPTAESGAKGWVSETFLVSTKPAGDRLYTQPGFPSCDPAKTTP